VKRTISIWYEARSARERTLLGGALLIAVAIFVWAAILIPFSNAKTESRLRYEAAALALGKARGEAAERRAPQQPARAAVPAGPPSAILQQAAEEAGFSGARITAAGARAGVSIEAARPEAAFAWVRSLEARGLRVAALRASGNPDRTIRLEAAFEAQPR
jgi:type II secretory pathway component PulM